jgi:uncharacterized membrane protein
LFAILAAIQKEKYMGKHLKEIIIFSLVSISSIFILGYTVHMFIGGLVSEETENIVITIACILGTLVVAYMAWDIINIRKKKQSAG